MNKLLKSKIAAWLAFALVILILCLTFRVRLAWWAFFDVFFLFMASFCHLAAVMLSAINGVVSRKLDKCAFWALVLAVIAFIGEWVAFECLF